MSASPGELVVTAGLARSAGGTRTTMVARARLLDRAAEQWLRARLQRPATPVVSSLEQGSSSTPSAAGGERLPPLWRGQRRGHLALLVLCGLGQGLVAGLGGRLLSRALRQPGSDHRLLLLLLTASAVVAGGLRMGERMLAERLSQDYVHELRMGLVRKNLSSGKVPSLGIAVARTTNDLTAVKTWVSQGVAALAVGVPLLLGASVALLLISPVLALGLLVPFVVVAVAVRALSPAVYRRSRALRRQRGRLSSQVADVVLSTPTIRSAGGVHRELQSVDRRSRRVVEAAVDRATVAGALRGATTGASGLAVASTIALGIAAHVPAHALAGALTVLGFMASPLHDLGRVAEFRQSYRAARRKIAPAVLPADGGPERPAAEGQRAAATAPPTTSAEAPTLETSALEVGSGWRLPPLQAWPGDRIVVDAGDAARTSEVLERFVGLSELELGVATLAGHDVSALAPKQLRRLVGYAAQGLPVVRGTVARTLRYRSPQTPLEEVPRLLAAVGLDKRVAALPDGAETVLVHGGEPLRRPDRARLLLAAALLDDPPLLVLDRVDADLGAEGRELVRRVLASYPGILLLASDEPELLGLATKRWQATQSVSA